jgi:hypothetical protein
MMNGTTIENRLWRSSPWARHYIFESWTGVARLNWRIFHRYSIKY